MNAFMLYQSGVMTNVAGCGTNLDHAVTVVGYNTSGPVPYYIVRNSWGSDWGEGGYINLAIVEG
jgi:C1A family cysteine protease